MKQRTWMALYFGALAFLVLGVAIAGTNDVFRLKGIIRGVIQFGTTVPFIDKVQITEDDLINLALGRDLGTRVATNEVLALTSGCGTDDVKFVVFDINGSSNLATIAELDLLARASSSIKKQRQEMLQFTVPGSGGPTNALTGGTLLLGATSTVDTNGCIRRWNGSLFGVLNTLLPISTCTNVITNVISGSVTNSITNCPTFMVSSNFDVIISKTSYSTTGKKIGTVVDEP
jgi:hypothetical protein